MRSATAAAATTSGTAAEATGWVMTASMGGPVATETLIVGGCPAVTASAGVCTPSYFTTKVLPGRQRSIKMTAVTPVLLAPRVKAICLSLRSQCKVFPASGGLPHGNKSFISPYTI